MTKTHFAKIRSLQNHLESSYGAVTGLDVCDFLVPVPHFKRLGELLVEQEKENINIALLLDRDILAASNNWQKNKIEFSVLAEEISHFVYLSFNHQHGRNVTRLEMELQSEVDRIFLAFQGQNLCESEEVKNALLDNLFNESYSTPHYEEARSIAKTFIQRLSGGHPSSWTAKDLIKIQKFFHSDLSEKIHLSRKP